MKESRFFKFSALGAALMMVFAAAMYLTSCSKQESQDLQSQDDHVVIDGFPDSGDITFRDSSDFDVCSSEEEDGKGPIYWDVDIVDGVMVFDSFHAMINTMQHLMEYNADAIRTWESGTGFTSLYSEYERISALTVSEMAEELESGRLAYMMDITEQDSVPFLDMPLYNCFVSTVLNADGLVRIGDYIGTVGNNVNIWTDVSNKTALLEALDSHELPENKEDFVINDDRYFSLEERADFSMTDSGCPYDASFCTPEKLFTNPTANRRIRAQFCFSSITSPPKSNGLRDFYSALILHSKSFKGASNGYSTNHYWSYNFNYSSYVPNATPINLSSTGHKDCTKHAKIEIPIAQYSNVSISTLQTLYGTRFQAAFPGVADSGQTGTSVSHRGMGGRYVRFTCN